MGTWRWNINRSLLPTTVSSLGSGRTAVEIASGKDHVCVLLDNGSVSCWGGNGYGALGIGLNNEEHGNENRNIPTQTSSLGAGKTAVCNHCRGLSYMCNSR